MGNIYNVYLDLRVLKKSKLHGLVSLMNTDAKFLNKISPNKFNITLRKQ